MIKLTIPLWYAFFCGSTYLTYWRDKHAAQEGRWRTRESTLHFLSLLGGWPAALLACRLLSHKSRKKSFRFVLWLTALANCAALVALVRIAGV